MVNVPATAKVTEVFARPAALSATVERSVPVPLQLLAFWRKVTLPLFPTGASAVVLTIASKVTDWPTFEVDGVEDNVVVVLIAASVKVDCARDTSSVAVR